MRNAGHIILLALTSGVLACNRSASDETGDRFSELRAAPREFPAAFKQAESYFDARKKVIEKSMDVFSQPAESDDEIVQKTAAIHSLGELQAEEAVPLLIQHIDFADPAVQETPTSSYDDRYPCVKALILIGKPASNAALDALENTHWSEIPDAKERVQAKLLGFVIYHVEGPKVSDFLLQRRLESSTDTNRGVLRETLEFVQSLHE